MAEGKEIELKSGKEINVEKWSNPLVGMSNSQERVGILLEVAYLALKDHPKVATEVRLSANSARTQHKMTLGLMKTYVVTSSNILETMVPLIRKAVVLKKNAIVKPMFMKVLKSSEEMRDEAIKTRQSYFELQDRIQRDTAKVNEANSEVEEKQKEIETKRKYEEGRKNKAEETLKKLEKQRKEKDEEMRQNKEIRDKMLKRTVHRGGAETCKRFIDDFLTPTFTDKSGKTAAVQGVYGVIELVVNTVKEHNEGKRALKASGKAQEFLTKASEDREKIDKQMYITEKETIESGFRIEMLDLEKSSLGDLVSLIEASEQLASIDGELVNIIIFWDNLAAFLKSLNQKGEAGECFLEAIEDDECAAMFTTELEKVEKGWMHFGSICSEYVKNAENVIPRIYDFLSQPIDKMGIEERKKRSNELIGMLKAKLPVEAP